MQQPRRRIPSRRTLALAGATTLVIAATASASSTLSLSGPASAGPVATADEAGIGPCRISATMGVQMSEGMPTPAGYSRSTGEVHALNLMIDFPDAPGLGSAMDRLAEFFPQTTAWFRTSSYGRLVYRPEAPVKSWLRMPLPFSAYGIDRGSPYEPGYRRLVQDIVAIADQKVDFREYDLVNVLVTPNAGPSALDTVLSVTFSGNADAPLADGVPLANTSFIYSRQDDGSGSYAQNGYRVLPHENSHVFGLPDLYTMEGGGSVGHWDIMSEDWGANNDLLGWHKWKLGWLDGNQISCASKPGTTDRILGPLATRGGLKLAFVPLSAESGYAVEVRTQAGNDRAVCRPGVLIYKVRSDVDTGEGPVTVADSTKGSRGCTRSPNVQAELSDAPFQPGQTFTDAADGIRISVVDKDSKGNYRVRITRS
ncbi:M6 family metalloprotease domain-containing protein [Streptomyces sp. NBC_01724]|uniref:M6 family metalloprotease domain-containing protein n=1 Tax=unclassified Streptomyces TaxID=2593676 RepID=UPI0028C44394|nr:MULTISPECIES: M6 family metalloprotease domain-containing protein [unclassified Streptomyces]WNO65415.1 M6 family metalloprotease domain-containing protein [Streptomyces sp. AM2-3-1]WSC69965.1 M6 family metalloprotease domain-containing protein [Streptomyces sp. NBC_01760]WTE60446.1 M6 family metalloprotease domain-containing protein [Streptomyces sp. NBC_01617]WTI87855.1 M6 family metalloprotease domain-containing protein [Streptomyces sp. NBC_00724]